MTTGNEGKRDFDREAASWDEDPTRVRLAEDVATAIREQVTLTSEMDALDFGCGTGLVTLRLLPFVRSITGVDSSQGMLDVLKAKVERLKLSSVSVRHADIENGGRLGGPYHLIVSSMTFHHIRHIGPLLRQFLKAMAPGGWLCVADLDPEGGRFHRDKQGVFHFGFDRQRLREEFASAGFADICDRTAATVTRPSAEGVAQTFTVFLMTARRGR